MTTAPRRIPRPIEDSAPPEDSATQPVTPAAPSPIDRRRLVVGPPAPIVVLPAEAVRTENLGVGELLDIAEALDTDLDGVAGLMTASGVARGRFLVALAWVVARRSDPSVTFAAAQRWRIEVDTDPDPTPGAPPEGAPNG